eukprot:365711-Chlamydomonas_euryale.AAC.22
MTRAWRSGRCKCSCCRCCGCCAALRSQLVWCLAAAAASAAEATCVTAYKLISTRGGRASHKCAAGGCRRVRTGAGAMPGATHAGDAGCAAAGRGPCSRSRVG